MNLEIIQAYPSCVGIEFSGGRCEVWTRPDGIQASIAAWLVITSWLVESVDIKRKIQKNNYTGIQNTIAEKWLASN